MRDCALVPTCMTFIGRIPGMAIEKRGRSLHIQIKSVKQFSLSTDLCTILVTREKAEGTSRPAWTRRR